MTQDVKGDLYIMQLNELDSSFIKYICYNVKTKDLELTLNGIGNRIYVDFPFELFMDFSSCGSFGSFYHQNIKDKFKFKITKMDNQKNKPKGINKAKKEKRFIDLDVQVSKINKRFLFVSQKTGEVYLKMRLHMLPDGEVDKFENLGFITQNVPNDLWKADKDLKGEILGNGKEIEWENKGSDAQSARTMTEDEVNDLGDDLPF